jgi:hypothetical protein
MTVFELILIWMLIMIFVITKLVNIYAVLKYYGLSHAKYSHLINVHNIKSEGNCAFGSNKIIRMSRITYYINNSAFSVMAIYLVIYFMVRA